jgi:hypothetical protein
LIYTKIKKIAFNPSVVPVIKEKPKVIKIVKKKTVIVECTVLSKFQPECTWFKESEIVAEDDRHRLHVEKIKEGEFAVKLEIEQISQADKGKYKLVARNEKGEATSQVVEIQEIPEEPDIPRIISGLKSIVSLNLFTVIKKRSNLFYNFVYLAVIVIHFMYFYFSF